MEKFTRDEARIWGLSNEEVAYREERGLRNVEVAPPALTIGEIVYKNAFTYFNFIFLFLGTLLCLVGSYKNLTFLPVIVSNTLIGIFQEIKSKRVLEKLSMIHTRKVEVIRAGKHQMVDVHELVQDDVVYFRSGNQICADAVVLAGEVNVDEALLTGESDEMKKTAGEELLSGSFVVNGSCYARLTKVGEESYISKLTLEAKAMKSGEQSEMMKSLDGLVKLVGIGILPVSIILFVQSYFFAGESMRDSVVSMVAAIVGMIPEGLYLLASIALVVSARRLAGKKVMLHDMKSIETLARVDVLCVDKTGTITEEKMRVEKVCGIGIYEQNPEKLELLLGDFVSQMSVDNATMEALKERFTRGTGRKSIKITPFSSKYKYSAVEFEEECYVVGAPEILLGNTYVNYQECIEKYNDDGYRVLLFGRENQEIELLAFLLLANKIRENAAETFAYFREQGVEIKVISGDHPFNVAKVAKEAGIVEAEVCIDGRTLTSENIEDAVLRHQIFGRVTPEQKKQFVEILKANGKTVAMTGDGVNDILALKEADCSVAMASGSDAAVQASQVVLLDSDFSKMPKVVLEGRRVVNNIQRSASLFLVKNIFSVLLAAFSILTASGYPFEPSQVTLLGMFTIGMPAFFLAMQPNKERISGNFIWNVTMNALPAGLADSFLVIFVTLLGNGIGLPEHQITTIAALTVGMVGIINLYKICQPMDQLRAMIWIGSILGFVGCVVFFADFFAIVPLGRKGIIMFVVFALSAIPVLHIFSMLVEKGRKKV